MNLPTALALVACCLLAPSLLTASPNARQLESRAMSGDTEAIMALTDAYFSGESNGIARDLRQAFIWGSVYMELVPNFPRGVERVTIFSEQELQAEGRFTEKDAEEAHAEVRRLTREIRAARQKPQSNMQKTDTLQYEGAFMYVEPSQFVGANGRLNLLTMRVNGADVVSLCMLDEDPKENEILRNPEKFSGRQCRVTVGTRRITMRDGETADVRSIAGIEWLD